MNQDMTMAVMMQTFQTQMIGTLTNLKRDQASIRMNLWEVTMLGMMNVLMMEKGVAVTMVIAAVAIHLLMVRELAKHKDIVMLLMEGLQMLTVVPVIAIVIAQDTSWDIT
jgi:hypothetical protein